MKKKKLLTLEDLAIFCQKHKLYSFDAKQEGYQLCVQSYSTVNNFDEDNNDSSLVYADVIAFHTGLNRNKSNVTLDAAKKAIKSMAYKPILANFTVTEDGEKDFTSHDFTVTEDGGIEYQEHQVGCFTADEPYIQQDSENEDRQYVIAKCAIPKEYTDTVDIIKRKNGTKCSVELIVNEMSYDSKNKELLLTDIEVSGLTLLGTNPETGEEVSEGMQGARVDIADFSIEKNSICFDHEKTLDIIQGLKNTLDNYITAMAESSKKGGKNAMEIFEENVEVAETPEEESFTEEEVVTEEEVDETEAEESTEEVTVTEAASEETANVTPEEDSENNDELADNFATFSITVNGETKTFSTSLIEKLNAIYDLVNATYSESDNDWYDIDVFDEEKIVLMHGWVSGKTYRQSYSVKKDVYSLKGDRIEVFATYLTKDEQEQFENMKKNYSVIESELGKFKEEPEKMAILNSEEYSSISESEEFVAFKVQEAHFDLSVDEVRNKADEMLLNAAKSGKVDFSANNVEQKKEISMKKLPIGKVKKSGRYGGLFSKN